MVCSGDPNIKDAPNSQLYESLISSYPVAPLLRFKAYVELATDAAQRWIPSDAELNQCLRQHELLISKPCG